ncbi:YciI family protein [Microbacterium pygmaeum]|uniref:Uncharacterized conserved protein n=1 Tax=Microbacterium pygmaeum TaxID=370764 RepID=A0A1G7XQ66_9MICO|nr:YciI family protein [Microbacterium pygmaeum]SDG86183.1 Uncharacterized conserved protein [Microbacterium pygmaeum]
MKFMMLVIADPTLYSEEETPITVDEWVQEYDGSGVRLDGERLRPPSAAKTVRRRNGKVTVTDGPFAETHEWIAGFDILECESLEDAVAVATRHPMATHGTIEVRAFWPFEG